MKRRMADLNAICAKKIYEISIKYVGKLAEIIGVMAIVLINLNHECSIKERAFLI